ncbi:porin family protein [Hymenobacter rubidus]|uniref:porin family protein n=1 Tax=Hymenobacter rubidus TaxID=1441626 RepID=UPI00191E9658|nr:porin family protein [Hymenobacter rubidus]
MRTFFWLMVFWLGAALVTPAQHLGISLGAQGGLTTYGLAGKITRNTYGKLGFCGGPVVRWQPLPWLAVQPELLLTQQGAGYEAGASGKGPSPNAQQGTIALTYLNVPVLAKFYLAKPFHLLAGPQLGFLLKGHEVGPPGYYLDANNQLRGVFNGDDDVTAHYGHDFSVVVGGGADLPNGLTFSLRLAYGLRDVNRDDWERELGSTGIYNRGISLVAGYFLKHPKA